MMKFSVSITARIVLDAEDAADADTKCFGYMADMFELTQVNGEFMITKVEDGNFFEQENKEHDEIHS
jgi:hypothetical protein